jgi:hypothetical protein
LLWGEAMTRYASGFAGRTASFAEHKPRTSCCEAMT